MKGAGDVSHGWVLSWTMMVILVASGAGPCLSEPADKPQPAIKENECDDYFGNKIDDPYRWMESGVKDQRFVDYLKAQNNYTRDVLSRLDQGRKKLLSRIQELDCAIPSVRSIQRTADGIFYLETAPGKNTASLMVRDKQGKSHLLLDPEKLMENGSHAAIDYYYSSHDGKFVAVGVSKGGSENSTIRVVDVGSGKLLSDAISRTQYGFPSWCWDSRSFYYSRLQKLSTDAPQSSVYKNEKVFLHHLGQDPEIDKAVFGSGLNPSVKVPEAGFLSVHVLPDKQFVSAVYSAGTTCPISLFLAPIDRARDSQAPWVQIMSGQDQIASECSSWMALHGANLYLIQDRNAPNRQVVALNVQEPLAKVRTVVIPQTDRLLLGIYGASDALYVSSKIGLHFYLQRYPWNMLTSPQDIELPFSGTISGADADPQLPGLIFRLESWVESAQAFAYDPDKNAVTNLGLIEKHPADFSCIEARELKARCSDGTMVPVSVLCRKDIVLDSSHPCIAVGYGAYGVSLDPFFDASHLSWLERGGIIAFAHLRGGGEFGESWHDAGRRKTKRHTIDDMVAVAKFLIENKYTSPQRLAVKGTSAGGIACGGVIVQHPELFAVAIDNVGITDMLRFQTTQVGAANIPEFGDVKDESQFDDLYSISAYHHIKDGMQYPAVMGITGLNDPRVPGWMIAKFVARLQEASASCKPVLLRVDFDAGHGLGSTRTQREEQMADERSFMLWQMNDPLFQPR